MSDQTFQTFMKAAAGLAIALGVMVLVVVGSSVAHWQYRLWGGDVCEERSSQLQRDLDSTNDRLMEEIGEVRRLERVIRKLKGEDKWYD